MSWLELSALDEPDENRSRVFHKGNARKDTAPPQGCCRAILLNHLLASLILAGARWPNHLLETLLLAAARKQAASREILRWMTPSEAPKALQASECSELLDPMRAKCWISAQH